MNKKQLKKFGILFLLHAFQAGIIAPVISLLFLSKGIQISQLAIIMGVYAGTVLLLEVPTGVLADLFGRKKIFLLAIVFSSASIIVFIVSANIVHIVIGIIFYGTSRALSSGSLEALFIDKVIQLEGKEGLAGASAKLNIYESLGLTIGAVIGGFLPTLSKNISIFSSIYDLNLLVRLAVTITVGILTIIMIVDISPEKFEESGFKMLKNHIKLSGELLRKETKLLIIFLSVFSTGIFFFSLETYWQPQFLPILPNNSYLWILGIVSFFYFAAALLGTLISKGIMKSKKINANILYPVGRILLALSFVFLAIQIHIQGFIMFFALVYLFLGISSIPESVLMNEIIPSRYRASILSLNSFILQTGALCAAFFSAKFLVKFQISALWVVASGILFITSIFFVFLLMRKSQEKTSEAVVNENV